jgi:hypothetical protein
VRAADAERSALIMNDMQLRLLIMLLAFLIISETPCRAESTPDEVFDQYGGAIRWEDEKARLDNFAIQLQQSKNFVGYIFVFDAVNGCPGEAQARAIRAKRYMVEHRGIPWDRVIWRREGYRDEISTILHQFSLDKVLPYPYFTSHELAVDGPANRTCKAKLQRIRKSTW